ncbi:hypothetical protein [Pseudooceanicola aestuarii]|uniref:hypothetical protein n=1 Tax=Pseudooceanicola aestuarii TaxID=2697319 RepID=UPI0013D34EDD|nr:hypothetical protein [Pseudooceanicola aestuarii]
MSRTFEALKSFSAKSAPQVYQAGLIFTDESDVAIAQLTYPILAVMQAFGQEAQAEPELDFDRIRIQGATLDVEAQIFDSPEADPDTHCVVRQDKNTHLDAVSRQALENPTFWLHVTIKEHGRAEGQHPEASKAMLAELLHHCIAATGAPFVQWLNGDTVLTSRRFQSAFSPILMPADEAFVDEIDMDTEDLDTQAAGDAIFPEIEENALDARFAALRDEARQSARQANTWVGTDPARVATRSMREEMASLAEVFRTTPEEEEEERPIEARLATWTVNATVAVINPPVAATLAAYNLVKGEDFRISTHALTLTAVFAGLGGTTANAASFLFF